jgi:ABC-type Fe3+-hydroxamate transport system substrate-binding protein
LSLLRIASLVPSLTELVVAMGLRDQLVARTGFCIHPADAVRTIPKVGGTKDVNLATLRRLAPTHVLVNVDENRLDTVEAIRAWPAAERPHIIVTHPQSPHDTLALIDQLAQVFAAVDGVTECAAACHQELERELALTRPEHCTAQQVLYLIWREPWMSVARDTYISRMLAQVNWQTWPAVQGGSHGAARYPVVAGDEPWLAGVQQVLLSSEPYAFGVQHVEAARALCPQAQVRLIDGAAISWYGPRTAAGLRTLRELAA